MSTGNSRSAMPVIGKFSSARSVCTPYSASSGTSRSPSRSCSRARARAGEAERAAVSDERGVGRREALRDRARGARRRAPRTAPDTPSASRAPARRVMTNASVRCTRARARAVRRVVEQQAFADAPRRRRASRGGRAGRCCPFSIATAPEAMIAMNVRGAPSSNSTSSHSYVARRDELGELVERGVGEAVEKLGLAEAVAEGGGGHGAEAIERSGERLSRRCAPRRGYDGP